MRLFGDLYVARLKRRLLQSCLTTIIGGPVMCLGIYLLLYVVVPALEGSGVSGNSLAMVLLFAALVLFLTAVPVAVMAAQTVRRTRALNAVFEPLGLSGSTYMLTGRCYQGPVGGHEVAIYVYRGPTVEVRLQVPVAAAFRVVQRAAVSAPVANAVGAVPVPVDDMLLDPFAVYAPDHYWARGFLAVREAAQAIHWLMTSGASWAVFRQVELSGGELMLHLYGSRGWFSAAVDGGEVRGWLEAMLALAAEVEVLPAPEVAPAASGPTQASRQDLSRFLTWAVAAIVVGLPLCAIVTFVAALFAASSS